MNRTRIKGWAVVAISLLVVPAPAQITGQPLGDGVFMLGSIQAREITESSGVVLSRAHPGVLWTHNDGGGRKSRVLHAMDRQGKALAAIPVSGVDLEDWEDIAIDDAGNLYIADVGNNELRRRKVVVHRLKEPDPAGAGAVAVDRSWELVFPSTPFNCESLVVWKGYGYLLSKVTDDQEAEMYRFPLETPPGPVKLEWVTRLPSVTSPVTGADLSVDGQSLALVAKAGAYLFTVEGDLKRAGSVEPKRVKFKRGQIEGCCFVPEGLLATSESRELFLFTGLK